MENRLFDPFPTNSRTRLRSPLLLALAALVVAACGSESSEEAQSAAGSGGEAGRSNTMESGGSEALSTAGTAGSAFASAAGTTSTFGGNAGSGGVAGSTGGSTGGGGAEAGGAGGMSGAAGTAAGQAGSGAGSGGSGGADTCPLPSGLEDDLSPNPCRSVGSTVKRRWRFDFLDPKDCFVQAGNKPGFGSCKSEDANWTMEFAGNGHWRFMTANNRCLTRVSLDQETLSSCAQADMRQLYKPKVQKDKTVQWESVSQPGISTAPLTPLLWFVP